MNGAVTIRKTTTKLDTTSFFRLRSSINVRSSLSWTSLDWLTFLSWSTFVWKFFSVEKTRKYENFPWIFRSKIGRKIWSIFYLIFLLNLLEFEVQFVELVVFRLQKILRRSVFLLEILEFVLNFLWNESIGFSFEGKEKNESKNSTRKFSVRSWIFLSEISCFSIDSTSISKREKKKKKIDVRRSSRSNFTRPCSSLKASCSRYWSRSDLTKDNSAQIS